ncbi:hypothetical protein EUX98_g2625 [Antrodiella citrinella]|uniref:Uncharacterized protein n=1 Tax=Antrodiella citrinella TaxID=2447956 RepID=A0A4S4MYL2_9APHY|nr:hypothetical protein EUX98_g2625 [Antrodiella citrinella]
MSITLRRSNAIRRPAGRDRFRKVRFVSCGPQVSFEDPIPFHPCDNIFTSAPLTKRYTPIPYMDDAIEKYFNADSVGVPEEHLEVSSHESQSSVVDDWEAEDKIATATLVAVPAVEQFGVCQNIPSDQSQSAIIADWEAQDKFSRATFVAVPPNLEKSQSAVVSDLEDELEPCGNVFTPSRSVNVIVTRNPFSFTDDGFEKCWKSCLKLVAAPAERKHSEVTLVTISKDLEKSRTAIGSNWEDEIEACDSDIFPYTRATKRPPFPSIDAVVGSESNATSVTTPLDLFEFHKSVSAMVSEEDDLEDIVVDDWAAEDAQWL